MTEDSACIKELPKLLLPWYEVNRRQLPWREDREPYHVWLSEIMLQQTRVEAVKAYYERFLRELPTIEALAQAPENQLLKLWEGLGYYSRVRNLQKAAKQIVQMGTFPTEYSALLKLSGIGPYTAGAIASICFEQPVAAVDGNVIRVLSRFLAKTVHTREARDCLEPIYPTGQCGDFTQALMELGATVCGPNGLPHCESCPIAHLCLARKAGRQTEFPKKKEKKARRVEYRTVFLLRCGDKLAVCKRPKKGLLAGLWQFPDTEGHLSMSEALCLASQWGTEPQAPELELERNHIFTHVEWKLKGIYLSCGHLADRFQWYGREEIEEKIGLPTAYRQFLEL
ncbi:MAG: A/G-specific adenine glycosylase [Oscillospiraceae bacterium]|nr:A/G-specific adenine glycosylase [Oscillospiraceae bacterium]